MEKLTAFVEAGLPVKVLISSRRNEDIKARLQDKANIGIEATDNENDICTFVLARIASKADDLGMGPVIPLALQAKMVETFQAKSNGMCVY